MSTTLLYAFIMAITQIVLVLISYFLGFQTDKINAGTWFGLAPLVVSIVIMALGIKAVRDEQPGKYLSYGKGVGTGVLIALYAGIIGAIYTYIHFTYVNPNFSDYVIEASRAKWAAAGMDGTKMEAAEQATRMFTKAWVQAAFSFAGGMVISLILALILSAFLKRTPPEDGRVVA